MAPVKVFDNLYFVGTREHSAWAVVTSAGITVIDPLYAYAVEDEVVGGLKKVRAHDGSLELICSQERLLKIFRITGLAKVFVIHDSAEAALASR